ncbi:cupin domain-containing protein [Rhodococcus sp. IEGM 1307]|uniref:cupin domain-containing protein n=1 Tax=Rhodococcus sp. IEGM 1307 TaxID=3047091 RepID=UPI0024B71652|nr:cupin domain-containing protein [Rhodococcus sp. IEGM 1307]MDI9979564.1 cupin domain-containing protein [Rhodococcus sp. IEGM 1307]
MIVVDHEKTEWEEWRPGVRSRAWATAASGARQVRIAEQILDPGNEAPPHWHYFEENITIVAGLGRFTVDGETREFGPRHTVIVPSMAVHGFASIGEEPLHIIASMGWPINEMNYVAQPEAVFRVGETVDSGRRRRLTETG